MVQSLLEFELSLRDEILNGKTLDRNSHCFAQYCFEHGINLYASQINNTPEKC